mgnify:CR=1 FL=1
MTGVSPVLNMNVVMRQGAYISTYVQLKGVSQSYLEQLELAEGRLRSRENWGWYLEMG